MQLDNNISDTIRILLGVYTVLVFRPYDRDEIILMKGGEYCEEKAG